MADLQNDLNDIAGATDEGRLNQIEQYQVNGYKGNEFAGYSAAKQAIEARRAKIIAERQAAEKQAKDRENAINERKGNLVNSYADQARKQLSQSIVQNTQNAASRGLLHSGLKQGADQKARGQANSNAAGYQAQVNRASDQQLGGMELDAANEGLDRYQANANQAAKDYQNQQGKADQNQGVMGGLGQAIGGVAGGLLGAKKTDVVNNAGTPNAGGGLSF